jgi:choice-of-anchor C domain-containing protein
MKNRIATLAVVALLAGCGEAPTEPVPTPDLAPSFAVTPVALTNGGFESDLTGWISGDVFPGWGSSAHVDVVSGWTASEGLKSLDLNGFHPGFISQDIATDAGTEYTVVFDLAGNPGAPQNVKKLVVTAAGESGFYEFDTTGRSGTNMGWREESFSFTATAANTTLVFVSLHGAPPTAHPDRAQGPALDNIRVFAAGNDPETMDDCKKGGWEQYGFRNQGQCVRFVQTGKDSR